MKAKNHLCTSNGAWTKLRRSELHGAVLVWTLCFVLKTIKIPPVLLFSVARHLLLVCLR